MHKSVSDNSASGLLGEKKKTKQKNGTGGTVHVWQALSI